MWECEPSLMDEIRTAWGEGHAVQSLGDVAGNLKIIMSSMK
jgi:hypothetical protein